MTTTKAIPRFFSLEKKCASVISKRFTLPLIAISVALSLAGPSAYASTWTGANGNWSSDANPGWNTTGVPNAISAIADFSAATTGATTQDSAAGVTIGSMLNSGNAARTITNTPSSGAGGITFNNNGSGALIENSGGSSARFVFGGGGTAGITLADDLTIRNTSSNANALGSIQFSGGAGANLHGTGNLILSNVSNNAAAGQIHLAGTTGGSDFTGNVLIEKGAVTFGVSNAFGNSANVITLGSSGGGSATLICTLNTANVANNITVAAGTGGTLLLGGNNTSSSAITRYSGNVTLNGSVSLNSNKGAGADVRYTGVISGVGNVTTVGDGETQFGDGLASVTNTYTGDTTLTATSSLVLSDNAKLTFDIDASGVNNKISGTATQTLTLDGDFVFDLTGAASTGAWTIVDVGTLNETFGASFTVVGFSQNANVWTMTSGATTYTFTEADGILNAVPEPSSASLLALGGVFYFCCRRLRSRSGSCLP